MPKTEIRIYQEIDETVPLFDWLDGLSEKVQDKCVTKIERLAELGYELRRPDCDMLEGVIYELRAKHLNVNYRILYGFCGKNIVLLSHGCTKEARVPRVEIERARMNLRNYQRNPQAHTCLKEFLT